MILPDKALACHRIHKQNLGDHHRLAHNHVSAITRSHMHIVCTKPLLFGSAQAHPTAMPPVMVMDKIEKIEAELASIHAMLKQLTGTKQREEGRRFGIVTVRGLQHIFAPWGTTIRAAKGDEARTQAHME